MNLAFETLGDGRWAGGEVFLRNLFHAIRHHGFNNIGIYTVAARGRNIDQEFLRRFQADKIIHYESPKRWTSTWLINGLCKKAFLTDKAAGKTLHQNGVEVLFGPTLLFRYPKIATLTWLPDFQHLHFPDMFSPGERRHRHELFLQTSKVANRVILLSESVKSDFASFAPSCLHKTVAIPPICNVPDSTYSSDCRAVIGSYNLPEKFVYLPNQFWKHKNHETAFQAVRILRDKGVRITMVCTGYPGDYRHAQHFAELWGKVSQWNLRDQVLYLGFVPREHVLGLMRQSVCVVNPSLFEGWGMSVDEARSLGKQLLISDIPAHREQDAPKAVYFDPRSREDMAEKLGTIWLEGTPGPDLELECSARKEQPQRLRAFAEKFVRVCEESYREVSH